MSYSGDEYPPFDPSNPPPTPTTCGTISETDAWYNFQYQVATQTGVCGTAGTTGCDAACSRWLETYLFTLCEYGDSIVPYESPDVDGYEWSSGGNMQAILNNPPGDISGGYSCSIELHYNPPTECFLVFSALLSQCQQNIENASPCSDELCIDALRLPFSICDVGNYMSTPEQESRV